MSPPLGGPEHAEAWTPVVPPPAAAEGLTLLAGLDTGPFARLHCPGDLPLLLVIEGQAERIPEGHQRPLHGIGLGLLEGGFMGLAQVDVDAVAGAAALADHRRLAGGCRR